MITAKVDGRQVQIETSWEEMPFGKFLDLIEVKDDYQAVLAIMLGEPVEKIKKAKIEGLEQIIERLRFLQEPARIDEQPTKIKDLVFPQDITLKTVEQFEVLRNHIQKVGTSGSVREQTEALAFYAAIYCQAINEPFDEEKAKYLSEQFKTYPCLEVMSAGSFFMAKVLSLQSGLPMSYLRKNTLMKKKKRGLKTLMKRLDFTVLWTRLRVMWVMMTSVLSRRGTSKGSTPK